MSRPSRLSKLKSLLVKYDGKTVGALAMTRDGLVAFEYADEWLASGFSISPFALPLRSGVFLPRREPFNGLFGIFADSLPDSWGRLLVDRMLLKNHIEYQTVDEIQRLAIVGAGGGGALTYEPEAHLGREADTGQSFDALAESCSKLLHNDGARDLDTLFRFGGSSGGARPKISVMYEGEEWIIKFPAHYDEKDIGEQEYDYSLCAKKCGVDMPETKLFPSRTCAGYFGVKRFDRAVENGKIKRIHMASAGALLETPHTLPSLDYNVLMKLTLELTKDFSQIERMFRLMCFNVFAHNRDDHSKNFAFLYDWQKKAWRLAPAYDLTYSSSLGGEHATSVNGNGRDPGMSEILETARIIGLKKTKAQSIAEEIRENVVLLLSKYI